MYQPAYETLILFLVSVDIRPSPEFCHIAGLQIRVRTGKLFSYSSTNTNVVGTHKNRLNEMVLLSTQNTCLN